MPCRDPEYDINRYEPIGTSTSKIEELTQLLCEANRELKRAKRQKNMSGQFQAWAIQHEEADRKREKLVRERTEKERLKQVALNKLTSEERKALGLI